MRALLVSVGFVAVAALSTTVAWIAVPGAAAVAPARSEAIVAVGPRSATATRADGTTRVELAWILPGDTGVAVSPDGRMIAFSSSRTGSSEIYVADTRRSSVLRLTANEGADDVEPAWSPDGRRLAWVSGSNDRHDVYVMNRDGNAKRRLVDDPADDVEPAWSPDGDRIAFASNRDGRYRLWLADAATSEATPLGAMPGQSRSPSWSPTGSSIAYTGVVAGDANVWVAAVDGSASRRLTRTPGFDGRPDWSPDGRRLAFVSNRGGSQRIWLMRADGSGRRPLSLSTTGDDTPRWADVDEAISPAHGTLLPDLDQQAPSDIIVLRSGSRLKLGFASAIDNVGDGPIHIQGRRIGLDRTMRADQLIHGVDGAMRVVREIGRLAYEPHPPHHHWHLEPYETYELYRATDGAFVGRDRKSGFCLLDRWGRAAPRPGIVPAPPRFVGDCAAGNREARAVDEGSSVGYTDRYPGFFHGQDIDITSLPAGLYVLVHRANPERRIRELRYSNNGASALIRISAADAFTGAPTATIVRRCPDSVVCRAD